MEGIKTFLLYMIEDFHGEVKKAAKKDGKSMNDFTIAALKSRVKEVNSREQK